MVLVFMVHLLVIAASLPTPHPFPNELVRRNSRSMVYIQGFHLQWYSFLSGRKFQGAALRSAPWLLVGTRDPDLKQLPPAP